MYKIQQYVPKKVIQAGTTEDVATGTDAGVKSESDMNIGGGI